MSERPVLYPVVVSGRWECESCQERATAKLCTGTPGSNEGLRILRMLCPLHSEPYAVYAVAGPASKEREA